MMSGTTGNELETTRRAFAEHLRGKENALTAEQPDSAQAHKYGEAITALVSHWDDAGITADVLLPLLTDARLDVRCEAARLLLFRGHEHRALPILESIKDNANASTTTKFDARKALKLWRRKTGSGLG